ncbi:MAG: RDD family protein [Gammaproteobacteria bacterium]|nr:RDD family protein [Gammaproteobacteria bacterium]
MTPHRSRLPDPTAAPTAGVFRRLAAFTYDLLLLGAIWMLATLIIVAIRGGEPVPAGKSAYQFVLLLSAALFFIASWLRGGQTLGMLAWRLRVETGSGQPLDLRTGIVRFIAGLLSVATGGLGLFWLWIDRDRLTWHDRLAHTRVVVLAK